MIQSTVERQRSHSSIDQKKCRGDMESVIPYVNDSTSRHYSADSAE